MKAQFNANHILDTKQIGRGESVELTEAQHKHLSTLDINGLPLITKEQVPLISKAEEVTRPKP